MLVASFTVALLLALLPTSAAPTGRSDDPRLQVVKAPVAPDGTTAGAALDFVVNFADPDPAVPGVAMKAGGTITIELDRAFDLSGNQGIDLPPGVVIILQGWPQSPRVPFPYTADIVGNTVTLTLTSDWPVGTFGPGPKSVHLALLDSTNPPVAGRYSVDMTIQPGPREPTLERQGRIKIIDDVRASVNVVSLFSGGGPPPPFFNPLFQDVALGEAGHEVGMYLWENGGAAAEGVDVQMINPRFGRLVQDGRNVGRVWIRAPRHARNYTIVSTGPSVEISAFVTGVPTGLLVTQFTPDSSVAGHYSVVFRMTGGKRQTMHYEVSD